MEFTYTTCVAGGLLYVSDYSSGLAILPLQCGVVGVGSTPAVPSTSSLEAYPNPLNPQTTISFGLARSEVVEIAIYDLRGRQLRTLADRHFAAGKHALKWDGLDQAGRALPSGIYLVRLQSASAAQGLKVSLVR